MVRLLYFGLTVTNGPNSRFGGVVGFGVGKFHFVFENIS